jgi:hypothetical protein
MDAKQTFTHDASMEPKPSRMKAAKADIHIVA